MAYVVDPTLFQADGAVVNWSTAALRLGALNATTRSLGAVIQLRWMINDVLGLPTQPFQVWARPHASEPPWKPLVTTQRSLDFLASASMITWSAGAMSRVSVDVSAPSGGVILAFSGAPTISNVCAVQAVATGSSTVELGAHVIDGLLVPAGISVSAVRGVLPGGLANVAGWKLIEVVGLPVTQAAWAGVGKHGEPQGLAGAFTDAPTAAMARLTRGAPPFGWAANLAAGLPAPAWAPPDYTQLVQEVNTPLLNELRTVVAGFAPNLQAAQLLTVALPRPASSAGLHMSGLASITKVAPLDMTLMAAATDPFLSLVLGFGTAYAPANSQLSLVATNPQQDFMVTAHWERGLDGQSAPLDYAAVIPAPGMAPAPPVPTNPAAALLGTLRPTAVDGNWRESVRMTWDRPPALQLFRLASFAAARAGISPVEATVALMQARPSGGYRPVAINSSLADPPDPEFFRLNVIDPELEIPANPGSRQLRYAAAVQDLYGQWTPWVTIDQSMSQPPLQKARVVTLKLTPTAPAGGSVCAATVELEFAWDWRVRTPRQITVVGYLYASATHGAPPPSTVIPGGFSRSLSGAGSALVVTFAGDVASCPGATIIPLASNGELVSGFGAPQGSEVRRFRLTLSALQLDFGGTPFVGLAVWAQGQEQIAPQRLSKWPTRPMLTSTGDPRPPLMSIDHVQLGSVPDASGCSHVQISWATQPNVAGYFVYESNETQILDGNAQPQPLPAATLDLRLQAVKTAFRANPLRRLFTRLNATLLTGTSLDIALPRGSTVIHVYVVLGVSAGQVESAWPAGPTPDDALIAIAAPRLTAPQAPMIEVQRVVDNTTVPPTYRANLLITTRPGPRAQKIEVHRVRVDEAAADLDTMGPPVARVVNSADGWTVEQTADPIYGPYIGSVSGSDAPGGSWRRVWYRATAWTGPDATRGTLPGRSSPSNAAWLVLPPADGPSLSALQVGGGTLPADITLQWTCASPVARTPLGPHLMAVRATRVGAPAGSDPLLTLDTTLDSLGSAAPSVGSGVWIVSTVGGLTTYRALLRRALLTDVVSFAVRITDPLGRTGAQLLTLAAGGVDPPADLENLTVSSIALPLPIRTFLQFSSSSPVVAPLDGPYELRVVGITSSPFLLPPPPSVTLALGDVPTAAPPGIPPAIYAVRSGAGPSFTYSVVTTLSVRGFVVRITAPNGTFVEKTVT